MSTNPRIYLDFNATSPVISVVREAVAAALTDGSLGNPSSIHGEGRRARDLVERARDRVARLVGRPREQIVFTSGGTEGNHLGVLGLAALVERQGKPRVVAGCPIDHPSLRGAVASLAARGWTIRSLDVDPDGRVDGSRAIPGASLVAFGLVNHELGTIADAATLIEQARAAGAVVHVDAVQAAGKLPLEPIASDSLVVSGHKLGAPAGIGALAIAHDDALPLVDGGHQERGRRAGTENLYGIVGLGAAAAAADPASWSAVAALGDRLERALLAVDGVHVFGANAPRVGGTILVGVGGALGESIVVALDLAGIACSTGAACTSGSVQPSAVLLALGVPADRAREAVRFSLGRSTTADEIAAVAKVFPSIVARARIHRRSR